MLAALPGAAWAAQPVPATSASTALPVAVQRAQQAVARQQALNRQLRQRVDALQRQQDQLGRQLRQRGRALEALRHQLDQLAPAAASTPEV